MALKLEPYDTAKYLTTDADVAAYLGVTIEDKELPPMYGDAIDVVARARGGYDRLASESGISRVQLEAAAGRDDAATLQVLVDLHAAFARCAEPRMVA